MLLLIKADARAIPLKDKSVHCCVTSPPYWGLRDYGADGQLGLEATPDDYIDSMLQVFREVWRVLRDDGTLWLNLGDSYAGNHGGGQGLNGQCADRTAAIQGVRKRMWSRRGPGLKPKDLVGIPWRVALALQAVGWTLRSDIIWHKPNPMPESVTDRPTKAHEYLFLLTKSPRYFYDHEAIAERAICAGSRPGGGKKHSTDEAAPPGRTAQNINKNRKKPVADTRNRRSVWTCTTQPYKGAHFATFPPKLIEPCILAGCPTNGTVLDPFAGTGTTLLVASENNRNAIGLDLAYHQLAQQRLRHIQPQLKYLK